MIKRKKKPLLMCTPLRKTPDLVEGLGLRVKSCGLGLRLYSVWVQDLGSGVEGSWLRNLEFRP